MWKDVINSESNCPPIGETMDWGRKISCETDGYAQTDFCASNNCHEHATCENRFDGAFCMCNENYSGDGTTCTFDEPVDECADGTHSCGVNAECEDTRDSYECKCKEGYVNNAREVGSDDEDLFGESCTILNACCEDIKIFYDVSGWILMHSCIKNGVFNGLPRYICDERDDFEIRYQHGKWAVWSATGFSRYQTIAEGNPDFCFATEAYYGLYECNDREITTTDPSSTTTTTAPRSTTTTTTTTTDPSTTTTTAPRSTTTTTSTATTTNSSDPACQPLTSNLGLTNGSWDCRKTGENDSFEHKNACRWKCDYGVLTGARAKCLAKSTGNWRLPSEKAKLLKANCSLCAEVSAELTPQNGGRKLFYVFLLIFNLRVGLSEWHNEAILPTSLS